MPNVSLSYSQIERLRDLCARAGTREDMEIFNVLPAALCLSSLLFPMVNGNNDILCERPYNHEGEHFHNYGIASIVWKAAI